MDAAAISDIHAHPKLSHVHAHPLPLRPENYGLRIDVVPGSSQDLGHTTHQGYDAYLPSEDQESFDDSTGEIRQSLSRPSPAVRARSHAMQVLGACRTALLSLELTRTRKSQIGLRSWLIFWQRVYVPHVANALCARVNIWFPKVDKVFRTTAVKLCRITSSVGKRIAVAKTDAEIIFLWDDMERRIALYRKWRQMHTQAVLEELRDVIEAIPVNMTDELFDDLKRGVFALDVLGDYHPGDSEAEARDLQDDQPLCADDFVRADPNIVLRPGFTAEFKGALRKAVEAAQQSMEQAWLSAAMESDFEEEDEFTLLEEMIW